MWFFIEETWLIKIKFMKVKNKRTTLAPPPLELMIETIRLIPLDKGLPIIKDDFLKFELKSIDNVYAIDTLDLRDLLWKSLANLQKEFLEYIWGKDSIPEWSASEEITFLGANLLEISAQTESAAINYLEFQHLWNQFKTLTEIVDEILTKKDSLSKIQIESRLNKIPIEPKFTYYKDRTVTVSFDVFTQAINKVDITYIRECKYCHRVFWAGRKDQFRCPPPEGEKKPSKCKNSYNVGKKSLDRKLQLRETRLCELNNKYKGKKVWAANATLIYADSKANLPKTKELNMDSLNITEILLNNSDTKTTFRFNIFDPISKRKGFIEFNYNSRLNDKLNYVFETRK